MYDSMKKSSSISKDFYDSFSSTERTSIDVYNDDQGRPESWRSSGRGTGALSVSFSQDEPVVIRDPNEYNLFGIYRKSDRWYGHRELSSFWEDARRAMSVRNNHPGRQGKEIDDTLGLEGGLVCSKASRVASLTAVLTVQRMQTRLGVSDPVAIAAAYGKFSIHAQASACKRASRYQVAARRRSSLLLRANFIGDAIDSANRHAAKHLAGKFRQRIVRFLRKDKGHISTFKLEHRFRRLSVHQHVKKASLITLGH